MGELRIDDAVLNEIAAAAKARGVANKYLMTEFLKEGLRRAFSKLNLKEILEQIAAMTPVSVEQSDSV